MPNQFVPPAQGLFKNNFFFFFYARHEYMISPGNIVRVGDNENILLVSF